MTTGMGAATNAAAALGGATASTWGQEAVGSATTPSEVIELIQRGRIILDVAAADLDAAEAGLGPFHEVSCHFRDALAEARRAWERLRAHYGSRAVTQALEAPPHALMTLGLPPSNDSAPPSCAGSERPKVILLVIAGFTYAVRPLPPSPEAPALWRLDRLPASEDGPHQPARLADGSYQCDCAQWIYQLADQPDQPQRYCNHLQALRWLGWL